MKIAILVFPGSNCERETMLAVQRAGMISVEVLWNAPTENWDDFQGFILVGGFSYEDRGRAGVVAAHLPILEALKVQSQLGKPILGICNGAQILVESGLVPGAPFPSIALTDNKRIQQGQVIGTGFYNAWVHIKPFSQNQPTAFTRCFDKDFILTLPTAHAEGRFLLPDSVLAYIENGALPTLQYCDTKGHVGNEFPTNPNGSTHNIAALCNQAGNVMAIMPHPERTPNGDCLFQSMREYIESGSKMTKPVAISQPVQVSPALAHYIKKPGVVEQFVALVITDNQAFTIEKTFQNMGIPIQLTRRVQWEISCESPEILSQIMESGVLYNDKKERLVTPTASMRKKSFLVRPKENLQGLHKAQVLKKHFAIEGPLHIERSILWQIETEPELLSDATERVIQSSILWNPISEVCQYYEL